MINLGFVKTKKIGKSLGQINWKNKIEELYNQLKGFLKANFPEKNFLNFKELRAKEEIQKNLVKLIDLLKTEKLSYKAKEYLEKSNTKNLNRSNSLYKKTSVELRDQYQNSLDTNSYQKELVRDKTLNFHYYQLYKNAFLKLQELRKIWALEKNQFKKLFEQVQKNPSEENLNQSKFIYEKEEFIKGMIAKIYPTLGKYKSLSTASISSQMRNTFYLKKNASKKLIPIRKITFMKVRRRI